jgi:YHS domain-containing protein
VNVIIDDLKGFYHDKKTTIIHFCRLYDKKEKWQSFIFVAKLGLTIYTMLKICLLVMVSYLFSLGYGSHVYGQLNTKENLALEGYDAVSYFKGKPVKGNEKLKVHYQSVYYQFSSQDHLNLFLKNPSHYLPAYGGWCAFAMGNSGEKVEVNPLTYKIVNGKLYLFYNSFFNNTLTDWNKDEVNLKIKADSNWKKYTH